jgi:hypothetical protein
VSTIEKEADLDTTMATGVVDEHRFKSQCSLYEPPRVRPSTEQQQIIRRPTTAGDLPGAKATSAGVTTRVKYSTQTSVSSGHVANSIHSRHSVSGDLMSLIRSIAMKPFKASSLASATAGGQTSNIVGGNSVHAKPQVNLVRYRPLSDGVTDHVAYTQSTRVCNCEREKATHIETPRVCNVTTLNNQNWQNNFRTFYFSSELMRKNISIAYCRKNRRIVYN